MMVESRNKQVKMDRERVVRGINSFLELCELAPNQVRICGGGAMVLRGVLQTTKDLDVMVSASVFEQLSKNGCQVVADDNGVPNLYHVTGHAFGFDVKIIVQEWDPGNGGETTVIDYFFVETLSAHLTWMRSNNRPKDEPLIMKLERDWESIYGKNHRRSSFPE